MYRPKEDVGGPSQPTEIGARPVSTPSNFLPPATRTRFAHDTSPRRSLATLTDTTHAHESPRGPSRAVLVRRDLDDLDALLLVLQRELVALHLVLRAPRLLALDGEDEHRRGRDERRLEDDRPVHVQRRVGVRARAERALDCACQARGMGKGGERSGMGEDARASGKDVERVRRQEYRRAVMWTVSAVSRAEECWHTYPARR